MATPLVLPKCRPLKPGRYCVITVDVIINAFIRWTAEQHHVRAGSNSVGERYYMPSGHGASDVASSIGRPLHSGRCCCHFTLSVHTTFFVSIVGIQQLTVREILAVLVQVWTGMKLVEGMCF